MLRWSYRAWIRRAGTETQRFPEARHQRGNRTPVHRPNGQWLQAQQQAPGNLRLRRLRATCVLVSAQVRQWDGLAQLLQGTVGLSSTLPPSLSPFRVQRAMVWCMVVGLAASAPCLSSLTRAPTSRAPRVAPPQPVHSTHVWEKTDLSLGMVRKEVMCVRCHAHQGHVFEDGPRPTGLRWVSTRRKLTPCVRARCSTIRDVRSTNEQDVGFSLTGAKK